MHTTNEIFAKMPAETADQLFDFLAEKEKNLLKVTTETLAQQRKLRPIFVERKPVAERHRWMQDALGRRQNEGVAAHLLQVWLVGMHAPMLCDFLDALGIAHDPQGTIEEMPAAPDQARLTGAVERLFEKHDPRAVSIYLHAFQATDENGWPTLETLLAEDPRLKL